MEGEANVRGKVAYVPQQAWMRNTSLKENILFGKKLKQDVYDKVKRIWMCLYWCLYPRLFR